MPSYGATLRIFYAYGFLSSAMLDQFVWMVYLMGRGYPASGVGLAMLAFSVAYVIFSVPSSYLSDRTGRRPFLVWGPFLKVISAFLFMDARSLGVVLAGAACTGIASSVITGTDQASLHDVLVSCGREQQVNERLSRFASAQVLGNTLGGLLGGFIARMSYQWLYWAEAAVSAMAVVAGLFVPTVPVSRVRHKTCRGVPRRALDAVEALRSISAQGPYFTGFLALTVASWTVYSLGRDLVQPVLGAHDMDPAVISSLFTAGGLALMAGRRIAGRLDAPEYRAGFSLHMLPFAAAVLAGGTLGMMRRTGRLPWVLAVGASLVCGRLVCAFSSQIQEVWLLGNAPAGLKATTLSLAGSATALVNGVSFYLLGLVSTRHGPSMPLFILGVACLGLHLLWQGWRHYRPRTPEGCAE